MKVFVAVKALSNGLETLLKVTLTLQNVVFICIHVDVGDLQNFVNVALATSAGGEDDFANDKLSSLRTVGSGFASLIYELKEDTGSLELRRRCSSVWAAFINYPNLPELLVCWRYNYINLC